MQYRRTEHILNPESLRERCVKDEMLSDDELALECLEDQQWCKDNNVTVTRFVDGTPRHIQMSFPWHADYTQTVTVCYDAIREESPMA